MPQANKYTSVRIMLTKKLARKLRKAAADRTTSLSQLIREAAIEKYMPEEKEAK